VAVLAGDDGFARCSHIHRNPFAIQLVQRLSEFAVFKTIGTDDKSTHICI